MAIYQDKKDGKPTGRWRVELQVDGVRFRKRFDTHKEAQAAEALWRVDPTLADASIKPRHDNRGRPVLLLDLMRKAHGSLWRDAVTANQSWARCEDIIKALAVSRISELKSYHLDDLVELWSDTKSNATINRYLSALHCLLKWGHDRGYVESIVKFPWLAESSGRIRWITPEEQEQLTSLVRSYGRDDIADLIDVAIVTGMRRGELLGLTREVIEPTWVRLWKTKTNVARSVPIDPRTHETLMRLIENGMPTPEALRHYWDRAKADMGLKDDRDFVFHACRHTCATRLVQANVNLRVVQKFMGHKRIETTVRYAQVADNDLQNALATTLGCTSNGVNGGGKSGAKASLRLAHSS